MRICIVTPGALGSNPRVVKEAQTLSDHGHGVDVVCTRTLAAVDERDADIVAGAPWRTHRIDLSNPWAWRLRRLVQIANGEFSAFTGALTAKACAIPADLYIAHYPAALPAAAAAARKHGAAYAFDAEDFHPGDAPEAPRHDQERALIDAIERRYLPDCAYVTAASPGIAEAYAQRYGVTLPTVVMNAFPKAKAPEGATPRGTALPGPSVYWFSQTLGPDRGLECAVEAIGQAKTRPHLYLRGLDQTGFADVLRDRARKDGTEGQLHILAPGQPSQMERLAAAYDMGFVGETGCTPNRNIALTNKQFTYLLAGLPVVMSNTPGHAAFARLAGKPVVLFGVDDAADLARAMDQVLGDPQHLASLRALAYKLGQERFNWEAEQAKLLACVDKIISGSPSFRP